MSLAVKPIEQFRVFDPRCEVDASRQYWIKKGGSQVSQQPFVTQNYSNSQIQWSVSPPSNSTIIDRHIKMRIPFRITIAGADQGSALYQLNQGLNAIRAYPITQCISSMALQLNNTTFNVTPNEYISALAWCDNFNYNTQVGMSTFPTLLDQSQSYGDLVGSSRNPLNGYLDSDYWQDGRGSFAVTVVSNTNTAAVLDVIITEDLFISPLLFGGPSQTLESGLVGLNTLNLTLQLGNLSRILSHDATNGHTFTSVSVSVEPSPTLLITYITPELIADIPQQVVYGFENPVVYQTTIGSVNALASTTVQSNNLQINTIPSRIYVYARRRDVDLQGASGYTFSDCFANLSAVSISWDNRVGILSSATEQDLYQMSIDNGLQMSWNQWHGAGTEGAPIGVGSVLVMEPYKSWGLSSLQAPGLYGSQFNLQIQATFKNLASVAVNYDMFVVIINEGVLTIDKSGNSVQQLGVLSKKDILDSPSLPLMSYKLAKTMYGGNFLSDLKQFGSRAIGAIKKALPTTVKIARSVKPAIEAFAPESIPAIEAADQVARSLGYGRRGKGVVGGKAISRRMLRERM